MCQVTKTLTRNESILTVRLVREKKKDFLTLHSTIQLQNSTESYSALIQLLNIYHLSVTYRASLDVQSVKNPPVMRETWIQPQGSGIFPGTENGYPLQYCTWIWIYKIQK